MIIVRSPLRITLGGGGTDLASYYREHDGFLIAAAIDKYVYVTIHKTFVEDLIVKYSKLERVSKAEDLEHPLLRECLKYMHVKGNHLEICSFADIPAGTGLGSSGSFCTALLRALYHMEKLPITAHQLSELACHIEIDILGEPIGKQDQFIASYGGIASFEFKRDDSVTVTPLKCSQEVISNLEDNLMLFFTGYSRKASSILKDQNDRSQQRDTQITENLHFTKELGRRSKEALEAGKVDEIGRLMHEHWVFKRTRSKGMSNDHIDELYKIGRNHGASGGKLVGAGGGGFLMFVAEDPKRLRHAMLEQGLPEVRFRFDYEGSKVVVS